MSSFPILDLVVGVIFIFFLLSIICSSIVEMILTVTQVRAAILAQWLLRIFDTEIPDGKDKTIPLGQAIMDHCSITALSDPQKAPSYIDAKNFVSAALDKIATFSEVVNPTSIDDFIKSIETTTAISGELKRTFLIYANEAKDTLNTVTVKTTGAIQMFRNKLENWFDSNMDRLTGTLKTKYTRRFTFISALIVTLALNADTIEISKYLYNSPDARAKLAAKAYETGTDQAIKTKMDAVKAGAKNDSIKLTVDQLGDSLEAKLVVINKAHAALEESIPLGWNSAEFTVKRSVGQWIAFWLSKLAGMAVTIIAIMMGAPFWFDVLNKISNLRGSGSKPDESKKT